MRTERRLPHAAARACTPHSLPLTSPSAPDPSCWCCCSAIAVLGVDFMSENVRAILDEAGHKDVKVTGAALCLPSLPCRAPVSLPRRVPTSEVACDTKQTSTAVVGEDRRMYPKPPPHLPSSSALLITFPSRPLHRCTAWPPNPSAARWQRRQRAQRTTRTWQRRGPPPTRCT